MPNVNVDEALPASIDQHTASFDTDDIVSPAGVAILASFAVCLVRRRAGFSPLFEEKFLITPAYSA